MKIISILRSLSIPTEADKRRPGAQWSEWLRDPLAHPDLDAMSERELADLPFARGANVMAACGDRCL
jgi:hypothetical protein